MPQSPADEGLLALEHEVRRDLARLNYPNATWTLPRSSPTGAPMLDVLVAGGGMCGQTIVFGLLREGVHSIRAIDRNPVGLEGPWTTTARMETLRSPKTLTGPDLGIPSLTFRAWYEAQHGGHGWDALYKIDRRHWRDYLLWLRRTLELPIENATTLVAIDPVANGLRATLHGPSGKETVFARKIVLALGRDGSGAPQWPRFATWRPELRGRESRIFHASDALVPARLANARVGVLGAGASAFDNAATALEYGARGVVQFVRRAHLPQINKSKWASFPGFQRGFIGLEDEHRWALLNFIFDAQVPPPFESVNRCDRHPNFAIRFNAPWLDLAESSAGVIVTTAAGTERFDTVIVATGFDVDLAARAELRAVEPAITTWRDRVTAAEADAHPASARYPYLGAGFELIGRDTDSAATLANIHLFNWGSTMSHGALAGDIPGIEIGVRRLVDAIVRDLFVADADRYATALQSFSEPDLTATRYYVPPQRS